MSKAHAARFVRDQLTALLDTDAVEPAVLYEEHWSTWADLARTANAIESHLSELGVPRRGRVAVVLRNRPSGLAVLLGLLKEGRVPSLVSPIQPAVSIAAAIEAMSPVALVVDQQDDVETVREVALRACAVCLVISDDVEVRYSPDARVDVSTLLVDDDVALIVPTSGTTGPPKPIPMRWDQLPFDIAHGVRTPVSPESRPPIIHALSMSTITGVMGVLRAAARGRSLALLERVDVDQWTRLVERFQLRRAGLPPAAMRAMLDGRIPPERLASLQVWQTGSAPLSTELQRDFENTYGVPVLVAYGATEFGGAVAAWTLDMHRQWRDQKLGSVGRAVEGVELRIVDQETDTVMPPDTVGLLSVRVPGSDGTGDGWLRTNDLAHIDQEGFLFIDGRADDVIVRGGFKVPLGELESLLRKHPDVRDVAAVGIPEPRLGEVPAVAVVVHDGATVTPEEIRSWVRERTAPYKVPTSVLVLSAIPMSASHKVNRAHLRALLADASEPTSEIPPS